MNSIFIPQLNTELVHNRNPTILAYLENNLESSDFEILKKVLKRNTLISWKWGYCMSCFRTCYKTSDVAIFLNEKNTVVLALAYVKDIEPYFYSSMELCSYPTLEKSELEVTHKPNTNMYSSDPALNGSTNSPYGIYEDYI